MQGSEDNDMLRVGIISSTHGIRGEVKVYPTTDDPMRFRDLKTVIINDPQKPFTAHITNVRFFKNTVILKFREFTNANEAEKYRGCDLLINREQAVPLAPNENFIADLIGLKVMTDEGEDFGVITDIMQTGANDVYVITGNDGKEYLFPSIPECILNVDLDAGVVTVHIMNGLLDI